MNEYDSDRIKDLVQQIGYSITTNPEDTDCYVLNTCHIREKATEKVYHDIGRLKKQYNNKKKPILLVTGCVAQAENKEMLAREKYIDGIIGPQSYHQIPNIIRDIENKRSKAYSIEFDTIEKFDSLNSIKNTNSKISAFLTVQEGCDKFCNFCVVPYTRGPEHSRSLDEIIKEAKQLITNGAKEITLLGQNVNAYKYKSKKESYRLSDLIFELNDIKQLKRIRYTTSHPKDVTKDLIAAHKECKKLMPILHLPVQSGSTKILKSMNRKHSIEDYHEIIYMLKKAKPNIKFSSDFIIGYPGETEKDFEHTIELIEKIKFINSYSFIYSSRPGTPASKFKINENHQILKERLIKLQEVLAKINKENKKNSLNSSAKVLFENKMKNQKKYFGRDQYLNSVIVESEKNLTGQLMEIKINNLNHNSLFGTPLFNEKKNYAA